VRFILHQLRRNLSGNASLHVLIDHVGHVYSTDWENKPTWILPRPASDRQSENVPSIGLFVSVCFISLRQCSCDAGYVLDVADSKGHTCRDINECMDEGTVRNGSVSLTCLVTHDHLPRQARDRHDETLTERLFSQGDPCIAHEYSRCVNHPGGARCDCREGYVGQPLGPAGDGVNATVRFDNSVHSMISLLVGSRNSLVVTTLVLKKHHFVLPRHASKLGRPQRRSEQCVNVQLLGWLTGMHADSPAAG